MKKKTIGCKGSLRYIIVFTFVLIAVSVSVILLGNKANAGEQGPSIKDQLCGRAQTTIEDILWTKTGAIFQGWSKCEMREYKNEPHAPNYYVIRGWIDYSSFNQNVRTNYLVGFEYYPDADIYKLAEIETDIMGEMRPEPLSTE